MKEETPATPSEIFLEFDTCQNSIVHRIFPRPYGSKEGGTRHWIILYLAPMLATFGILLLLAFTIMGQPNLSMYIDKAWLAGSPQNCETDTDSATDPDTELDAAGDAETDCETAINCETVISCDTERNCETETNCKQQPDCETDRNSATDPDTELDAAGDGETDCETATGDVSDPENEKDREEKRKYETEMLMPLLPDLNYKPLHWDMNIVMMFLITFPLFIIFLVSEREIIPQAITSIIESKVLNINAEVASDMTCKWESWYARVNVISTIAGIGVGALAMYGTYHDITIISCAKIWSAVYELASLDLCTESLVNTTGWFMICCAGVVYMVVTITVMRSITTSLFLRDLVAHSTVRIIPFHPDKSGGLGPVGNIGLRNQYLLAVAGINILLMFWDMRITEFRLDSSQGLVLALIGLLVISYLIFGPLAFLGPLLPFRQAMKEEKDRLMGLVARRTDAEFQRIESDFRAGVYTQEDSELIARLQHLGKMIDGLPVWPFDSATLRKFLTAYVAPVVMLIITMLLKLVFDKYVS